MKKELCSCESIILQISIHSIMTYLEIRRPILLFLKYKTKVKQKNGKGGKENRENSFFWLKQS